MMGLTWLLLPILLLAGCSAKAEPIHVLAPASPGRAQYDGPVAPTPSATTPASTAQSEATLTLARKKLIDAFTARDSLLLSPDAVSARFAPNHVLKRERETVDGFVLVGGDASESLLFEYAPDGKSGVYCQLGKLTFRVSTAARATELAQAIEHHPLAKLGVPKKYTSNAESLYWKLGRRTEASLSAYSPLSTPDTQVVELRVSEPGGP
jgi:hypothetical protein